MTKDTTEPQSTAPGGYAALMAWLVAQRITPLRFCADLDIPQATLIGWSRGKWTPKLRTAVEIETYTRGAITPRMWVSEMMMNETA